MNKLQKDMIDAAITYADKGWSVLRPAKPQSWMDSVRAYYRERVERAVTKALSQASNAR